MYRHCIYCSAPLGTNEALERFPVGRMLAFDAAKGRLWAVCGRCARWNLSPIEERWEAVEDAERAFRGTRLRVQSENVGMAKLPDGTRLVRVGAALPGEVAAWRYGSQLRGRRKAYFAAAGIGAAGALLASGVAAAAAAAGATWLAAAVLVWKADPLYRRMVRRGHDLVEAGGFFCLPGDLKGAWMEPGRDDSPVRLIVPRKLIAFEGGLLTGKPRYGRVEVDGSDALQLLGKVMVFVNGRGATDARLRAALEAMAAAPGGDVLRQAAAARSRLGVRVFELADGEPFGQSTAKPDPGTQKLLPHMRLAVEMALHEEQERRAMEGELALLEAAWRDAEHIAEIADGLAGDVPARPGPADG